MQPLFWFHMKFKVAFSRFVKVNVTLMGIVLKSVNYFGQYGHFHNTDSSYSGAWNVFPFVFVGSHFFQQCFVILV